MKIKILKWYMPLTETWESKCGFIRLRCRKIYSKYEDPHHI